MWNKPSRDSTGSKQQQTRCMHACTQQKPTGQDKLDATPSPCWSCCAHSAGSSGLVRPQDAVSPECLPPPVRVSKMPPATELVARFGFNGLGI